MAPLNKLRVIQLIHHHRAQCHHKGLIQMKLFCEVQTHQDTTHLVKVMPSLVLVGGHLLATAPLVKKQVHLEREQARTGPLQHLMLMAQRGKQTVTWDPVLGLAVLIAPSMNGPCLRYCYMLHFQKNVTVYCCLPCLFVQ